MRLDHKINIKWQLGYCTKLLESFSSGNQIPSWHQSKRRELLNRENSCKLDGLRKVLHERITHHCLQHVFTARKVISNFSCVVLSHKMLTFKPNDKRTFVQQLRPSKPAVDRDKRDFKIQRRRQERERQKIDRFNQQNYNFARESHFFVNFFLVFARLRCENA